MNDDLSSSDPYETVRALIAAAEEKMQQTSQVASTHAFNLAVSFGILPAAIIMILVFLAVRGSLIAILITGILVLIALVIFASLVVNISRERSLQRRYQDQILPELLENLEQLQIPSTELPALVQAQLPEGSILLKFIQNPTPEPLAGEQAAPSEAE
ncbi:MAG: hypothetical protein A2Z16_09660 [Chloroflexi bacterium RBG_16_54_18]|nr:MAG: hypothetical protein A2Z16_09660 [Chloroflexi bacterium RBG_16_54_18]